MVAGPTVVAVGASTVVLEEAFTVVAADSMEAAVAVEVEVSTPEAVPQGEDFARAAVSEGEASAPAAHRHRAWAGAFRARCPAYLRDSGPAHRQDLAATFIVPRGA